MLGIIGKNGAGKSTLLMLLTRLIEPTSGQIEVNGRVGALLELGTGFHPDLTGRENVYLNGSILGFSRAEMSHMLDDIVGFSEMEPFIDVQVKHYSSGMYMRLGFSVAIHLQPDILLVDEVLAVGDKAFQLRCLDRIDEMKRGGTTIVLVSHDLDTVREMCDRAIWLDQGRIQVDGPVAHVIDEYMVQVAATDKAALQRAESVRREAGSQTDDPAWRWGSREGEIVQVQFLDSQGQEQRSFQTGSTFVVRLHFVAHQRIERPQFGLALYEASGFQINGPNTVFGDLDIDAVQGEGYVDYIVDRLPLLEGTYLVSVSLFDYEGVHAYDYHHQAYTFRVRQNDAIQEKYGSLLIPSSWRMGPTDKGFD
jgi:lipopolysaccharide transport system ATP-binding protein